MDDVTVGGGAVALPVDTAAVVRATTRAMISPHRWTLWTQRPRLIAYCLLVEVVAIAATVFLVGRTHLQLTDAVVLAGLAGMGIAQAELGRQVERLRRLVNATPHINMTSVWTFAAVLLLPPALVALLVAVLYTHLAVRSWYRLRRVPAFRTIFNASLVILTCYSAASVLAYAGVTGMHAALTAQWQGVAAIGGAAIVYFVVGALVALPGLTITQPSVKEFFGGWADNLLEIATLCLGMLTALALATLPALALIVVPPMLLLHRGVLAKQLEIAATTDDKTGLFNTTAWRHIATQELARAQRHAQASFGILMIDLDHFKQVNDTHGHLAGDQVLKGVATAISNAVRVYDSVGRFGGEEFVVLLPDIPETTVLAVAERVRESVADLAVTVLSDDDTAVINNLSVSIGVATYPHAGTGVDRLLQAADKAMYSAKTAGRNQVVSVTATA
ncbi:GGDEF domain-containing protein [Fodinicola feengrottensis]|uniref:GGDEF domain-containing protein n=2 Tax=Fodinicola feengrottensis TaxID=435914 RepID=A0ABN2ILR5_9ACTN